MRVGTWILIPAALSAQAPARRLPWQPPLLLPWQYLERLPVVAPFEAAPSTGWLRLQLTSEGVLSVRDAKGVERMALGLPGRPYRVWRDGGLALDPATGPWSFPETTPLSEGAGGLAWGAPDLRPSLSGLVWILEDGERLLTLLHPAHGRAVHLALPALQSPELAFGPDRLVVRGLADGRPAAWSLPWVALLPALAQLGAKPPEKRPGSVAVPFPE